MIASAVYAMFGDHSRYKNFTGLGNGLSLSQDDETIAFSYYLNGSEAIYTGSLEDRSIDKLTEPEDGMHHRSPQFSPDGKAMFYLAANRENIQHLLYVEDSETTKLTNEKTHVFSAAFSPDGETIYYTAIPTEELRKAEGQQENGVDLFSVSIDGNHQQLTDEDAFSVNGLSVSPDGSTVFYNSFDGNQRLYAYHLEDQTKEAYLSEHLPSDIYHPVFSPAGDQLAYTAVAGKSANGTFQYELFLMDTNTGEKKKLTNYEASLTSPVFFHQENRLIFLGQSNWPVKPAAYQLMTVDNNKEKAVPIRLSLPEPDRNFRPGEMLAEWVDIKTIAGLYILLFGLMTIYFQSKSNKTYLPSIISGCLAAILLLASIAAAAFNPWAGSGLFGVAVGLSACSGIILSFAFIYQQAGRK
ncbi:TolB family protein [Virgibacillus xinjiangensis]|uniref:TolB family protein n=1 Tax=Virgibacillus xinjiangensis TaxID=393090 RepID=A0ABV7CVJ4_9BACI